MICRGIAFALFVITGLQSLWLLSSEFLRPQISHFPNSATEWEIAAQAADRARYAARLSWPRSEPAVDLAITANASALDAIRRTSILQIVPLSSDTDAATTAARLGPSDARVWVILSASKFRSDASSASNTLKISFYTAPYDDRLFFLRARIGTGLPNLDEELQVLVGYELETFLRYNRNKSEILLPVYRSASPAGRRLLLSVISKSDPRLADQIRFTP